jgi:hypothetical protein
VKALVSLKEIRSSDVGCISIVERCGQVSLSETSASSKDGGTTDINDEFAARGMQTIDGSDAKKHKKAQEQLQTCSLPCAFLRLFAAKFRLWNSETVS